MALPFLSHWNAGAGVPDAATLRLTGERRLIVWLIGCIMISGATASDVVSTTVKTESLLVTLPAVFVATTL